MRSRKDDVRSLSEIADDSTEIIPLPEAEEPEITESMDALLSEDLEETDATVIKTGTRLTKAQIIEMLPEELKELMGMKELKKLTKAQLMELLLPDDEDT
ncbi:MAG: hypothetical protein ACW968_16840 [Candidatus Thorarchaeota archaeon]|jgi:hypothetical protein